MDGIFYGRFDMKCSSLDNVRKGEKFKVLEYNGVAADPAHIFDPAMPIGEKYREIYRHWRILYHIYRVQRLKGVQAMSLRTAWQSWRDYWRHVKGVGTGKS